MGTEFPLNNFHPCLGLGLPNPALQALCKLITASETGEQLISRVSRAQTVEPRHLGCVGLERQSIHWPKIGPVNDMCALLLSARMIREKDKACEEESHSPCVFWACTSSFCVLLGSQRQGRGGPSEGTYKSCHLQSRHFLEFPFSAALHHVIPPNFFSSLTRTTATIPELQAFSHCTMMAAELQYLLSDACSVLKARSHWGMRMGSN